MNRQIYRGVVLCGLFYHMACTTPTPASTPPPPAPDYTHLPHRLQTTTDTLRFVQVKEGAYHPNPDEYSQRDSTIIELQFPQFEADSTHKAIVNTLNQTIKRLLLRETQGYQTISERLEGFIEEFKVHEADMKAFGLPSSNWSFELAIEVLLNTSQVLALRLHQLEYMGGAHANTWVGYHNYDVQQGRRLQLQDLLRDSTQTQFEALAQQAFLQALQDSTLPESLTLLDSSAFVLPESFGLEATGLRFYYQPYDLGSLASASLSFFLSYQTLLPVLDTQRVQVVPMMPKRDPKDLRWMEWGKVLQ